MESSKFGDNRQKGSGETYKVISVTQSSQYPFKGEVLRETKKKEIARNTWKILTPPKKDTPLTLH
jgi:hypothetical protein